MSMLEFRITSSRMDKLNTVYLVHSDWDDFSYQTLYQAVYVDFSRGRTNLGQVKIGEYGLKPARRHETLVEGFRSPSLPKNFDQLEVGKFFSLGQDANYYENVAAFGDIFREAYFRAINDMAFDRAIRLRARGEEVTHASLLRTVTWRSVEDQFARVATGGPIDIDFDLSFPIRDEPASIELRCSVKAKAYPPQNIHVLIGRNGAGKSTTLHNIARMLFDGARNLFVETRIRQQRIQLANLVSVSFSAFDDFEPIDDEAAGQDGLTYRYIGIKKLVGPTSDATTSDVAEATTGIPQISARWLPRTNAELNRAVIDSATECVKVDELRHRLVSALLTLEMDPNFASFGLSKIIEAAKPHGDLNSELLPIVARLSSGHKVAFTVVTGLVERTAERSLVLIDEPEAHLHPPMLSALVRAISTLLADRNGLAIVATHSPVVLQEVPKSCVHIVENTGDDTMLRQPELETFGENVGTLTGEVFGLEVTRTGFHSLLERVAAASDDYADALEQFERHLGAEARAILRAMMAAKTARKNDVGS